MESILESADEFDKENPIIGERFIVEEVRYVSNEYDYNQQRVVHLTHRFDTKEEKDKFLEDNNPDKWHEFEIRREVLRQMNPRPYQQWF
jgi:hypothetical protein